MLKRLPNEVEALIYDFLFLPQDVRKLSSLSKYMKERANSIKFIKEKKKMHERTRMLIEDQNSYRYQSDDIANAWENYYNYEGKAYGEDLIHSFLLYKKNINLFLFESNLIEHSSINDRTHYIFRNSTCCKICNTAIIE